MSTQIYIVRGYMLAVHYVYYSAYCSLYGISFLIRNHDLN